MKDTKILNGGLNFDDSYFVMPQGDYSDATNIKLDNLGSHEDNIVTNLVGNLLPTNGTFSATGGGVNTNRGAYVDKGRNRVFLFFYNSLGFHNIWMYNYATLSATKLIENKTNFGGSDVFDFGGSKVVNVGVIYRTDETEDILLWSIPEKEAGVWKMYIKDHINNTYGNNWREEYMTLISEPPPIPISATYDSESTLKVNTLRRHLFQFRYRWIYKDDTKSVWSSYSKMTAPVEISYLETDTDATKYNVILAEYQTGGANVVSIDIAVRISLGNEWTDDLIVRTINKATDSVASDSSATFKFYNDGVYVPVDTKESLQLQDYVPLSCNALEVSDGRYVLLGGVEEGYSFTSPANVTMEVSEADLDTIFGLSVQTSATPICQGLTITNNESSNYITVDYTECNGNTNSANIPPSSNYPNNTVTVCADTRVDPTLTSQDPYATWNYSFNGISCDTPTTKVVNLVLSGAVPAVGVQVGITIQRPYAGLSDVVILYTVQSGDTLDDIGAALTALINSTPPNYVATYDAGTDTITLTVISQDIVIKTVIGISLNAGEITIAAYMPFSKYRFGLQYFDKYGRTNGVMTYSNGTINDFEVATSTFVDGNFTEGTIKVPIISASIKHVPPVWAKYYHWVRSENLSISKMRWWVRDGVDISATDYDYIDITSLNRNAFGIITPYEYVEGDRIKLFSTADNSIYDAPILGLVSATSPSISHKLKINKTPLGTNIKTGIVIYSPRKASEITNLVFYEFGERYEIGNSGLSTRFHKGANQNQSPSTPISVPATFSFIRGDVFSRKRKVPLASGAVTKDIFDFHITDTFESSVNSNGRPTVVDEAAKNTFNTAMIRFSDGYYFNTKNNNINRFYFENFKEADYGYGEIQRMRMRDRQLRIYQKNKTGFMYVLQQLIRSVGDGGVLSQSDQLLNDMNYYSGDFGIGTAYSSLESLDYEDYFVDPLRGAYIRVSLNGLDNISDIYKMSSYCASRLKYYTAHPRYDVNTSASGVPTIIGMVDYIAREYITHEEEVYVEIPIQTTITKKTLAFSSKRKRFTSFYSFYPQSGGTHNGNFFTVKGNQIYIHDGSAVRNTFYGSLQTSKVSVVFNQSPQIKKTFQAVSMEGNNLWHVENVYTNSQESSLSTIDFVEREGHYHAALLRAGTDQASLISGDSLKGGYIICIFVNTFNQISTMATVSMKYILSNLNLK